LKLIRYLHSGIESYGFLINEEILCLPALSKSLKHPLPTDLTGLISLGTEGATTAEELINTSSEKARMEATLKMGDATLLAPVPSPPKIICLGLNYRDHAEEQGTKIPQDIIIFMKPRTAIIGPNEPIVYPSCIEKLDYEAELAVIMGLKGKNIPISNVEKHIFGYTAFNDVSARGIQFRDRQWTRGKSFDTFAPIGPCVTIARQIPNPGNLWIRTRVNGEVRQNSSTHNMVFSVYEVIHRLSRVMTLEPGDVIATGTPAGVAAFMKPHPKYLLPGDTVEVEIEKIGTLRNMVIKEKSKTKSLELRKEQTASPYAESLNMKML
jgi:2-keto-4-pentenoate hydratase/2-oxohepta-3-ene-1,7-dioic acid hydratase in catechol pathway